jgi:HEAT repeat protein
VNDRIEDFNETLDRVVSQVAKQYRRTARADTDALLRSGVNSIEKLVALLNNPEAGENRERACWVLGRIRRPCDLPLLIAVLEDPDPRLRGEAARSLGTFADTNAIPYLVRTLLQDSEENVRTSAAASLSLLGGSEIVAPLLQVLGNVTEAPSVRGAAAEALAHTFDARAVAPLIEALSSAATEVRFWAAFALGELGDETALRALRSAAATDDGTLPGWGSVRQEASEAIRSVLARTNRPDEEA